LTYAKLTGTKVRLRRGRRFKGAVNTKIQGVTEGITATLTIGQIQEESGSQQGIQVTPAPPFTHLSWYQAVPDDPEKPKPINDLGFFSGSSP
jgi:hypothetical protein